PALRRSPLPRAASGRRVGAAEPTQRSLHVLDAVHVQLDPSPPRKAPVRANPGVAERADLILSGEPDPEIALLLAQGKARAERLADAVAPSPAHRRDPDARRARARRRHAKSFIADVDASDIRPGRRGGGALHARLLRVSDATPRAPGRAGPRPSPAPGRGAGARAAAARAAGSPAGQRGDRRRVAGPADARRTEEAGDRDLGPVLDHLHVHQRAESR